MPTRSFSLDISPSEHQASDSDELVIEIGRSHIALLRKTGEKQVGGLDVFSLDADEMKDLDKVLDFLRRESLLSQPYSSAEVFINHEQSVLVPSFKFNKEIAEDYLRIAHGTDPNATRSYDHIVLEQEMMNVYRVPAEWQQPFSSVANKVSYKHSYSRLIEYAVSTNTNTESIYVFFYHRHIIVAGVQRQKLCIIQSFEYDGQDDVLYYLLNLANQLSFAASDLLLHVSGMIDLNSALYVQLVRFFEHVKVDALEPAELAGKADQPLHYFTPFIKLAI